MPYTCYASCSFGVEGVLAEELRRLGFRDVRAKDARVYFNADERGLARANLWLRTADRVYIVLSEFEARTFDELFEGVRAVEFADILPSDARFPVGANAVRSALMSVSDIQSVSKKAVVRALERRYGISRFEENGSTYHIFVNLYQDTATVAINTSGAGLNRRGYRLKNVQAPLRETLAAALLLVARWHSRDLYDPMCGSGTIAIEAAMMAANIAPGMARQFDGQGYGNAFRAAFQAERESAREARTQPRARVFASDADAKSVALAKQHARNMEIAEGIVFRREQLSAFNQPDGPAAIVTNPPYAMRLGERKEVMGLYAEMGRVFLPLADTKVFVLSASEEFERCYGRKADKRRKLYNGNMRCTYYQYFRK